MRPGLHVLPVPAKQLFVGTEKDALRGDQRLPHVRKGPIRRRDLIDQRDIVERTCGIWRKVPEVFAETNPDLPGLILYKRTHDTGRNEDFFPANAVVLENCSAGVSKIHDPAVILQNRPGLRPAIVIPGGIVLENRQPNLRLWRGGWGRWRR